MARNPYADMTVVIRQAQAGGWEALFRTKYGDEVHSLYCAASEKDTVVEKARTFAQWFGVGVEIQEGA